MPAAARSSPTGTPAASSSGAQGAAAGAPSGGYDVVEPTQGNYQRVESLEGAEFPLLVVTGVDAQGQPSGTEPYNPDGR